MSKIAEQGLALKNTSHWVLNIIKQIPAYKKYYKTLIGWKIEKFVCPEVSKLLLLKDC